jgi:hypothetical protein
MFYLDNMAIQFPFAKSERVPMRMFSFPFVERLLICGSMVNRLLRRLSYARPPPLGPYNPPIRTQTPRQLFRACRFSDNYALFNGYNQKRRWPSTTGLD